MLTVHDHRSPLSGSDQVMVPAEVWTTFDRNHAGVGPIFVEVGEEGVMGRLRPADLSDELPADACRIPAWMWERLGAPMGDSWISITARPLPEAGSITLRPARHAIIMGLADPVAALTEALSASWSCLSVGMQLPLSCGEFDVVEIKSCEGYPVPAAAILDVDVALEFVAAPDYVEPPPPVRPPTPVPEEPTSLSGMLPAAGPKGFVPFSGKGRRLCDP